MIYNWPAIIDKIISERPELLPAILKNDIEGMSKKDIQFEHAFFKLLQERYEWCSNYPDFCAVIHVFMADGEFRGFSQAIYWLMEQSEKEGGFESANFEYAIGEFIDNMISEDSLTDGITDPDNFPTPVMIARMGYEYRFYTRYKGALLIFRKLIKEDE